MIFDLKPYPSYKDTKVPWLGKAPEVWKLTALKRLVKFQGGRTPSKAEGIFWNGETPWVSPKEMTKPFIQDTSEHVSDVALAQNIVSIAPSNSVLLVVRSGILRRKIPVAINKKPVAINQDLKALIPKANYLNTRYLQLFIKANEQTLLELWGKQGATVESLEHEYIARTQVLVPPLFEQHAVVKFLDWADRRITLIIAARKRRIQLLEEYRQVLINDAVTGKFDVRTGEPYPVYKDSGVEWLGKVPNTWSAIPVRRAYSIQLGKMLQPAPKTADDVKVPYLKAIHVQWFRIETNALPKMWATPDELKDYSIAPGDLLVCEGGEGGRCAIVESIDQPTIIQNALHRVRAKAGVSNKFLAYVLKAISSTGWFDVLMDKATIAHLTKEKFAALEIPFPSLSEQQAIAEYLDRETAKIDEAIEKTKKSIELWEELRTTLIADVVTGKYDVREFVEGLPEEEPELEAKIGALEASLQGGETEAVEGVVEEAETVEETA